MKIWLTYPKHVRYIIMSFPLWKVVNLLKGSIDFYTVLEIYAFDKINKKKRVPACKPMQPHDLHFLSRCLMTH